MPSTTEFQSALDKFNEAAAALNEAWATEQQVADYPSYMPSFDEFVADFRMVTAGQSPEDAFNEVASIAKGYFAAAEGLTEVDFARAIEDFEAVSTGGGVTVAVRRIDNNHVLAVTAENTCLYNVEEGHTAEEMLMAAVDPWLVENNKETV